MVLVGGESAAESRFLPGCFLAALVAWAVAVVIAAGLAAVAEADIALSAVAIGGALGWCGTAAADALCGAFGGAVGVGAIAIPATEAWAGGATESRFCGGGSDASLVVGAIACVFAAFFACFGGCVTDKAPATIGVLFAGWWWRHTFVGGEVTLGARAACGAFAISICFAGTRAGWCGATPVDACCPRTATRCTAVAVIGAGTWADGGWIGATLADAREFFATRSDVALVAIVTTGRAGGGWCSTTTKACNRITVCLGATGRDFAVTVATTNRGALFGWVGACAGADVTVCFGATYLDFAIF